MNFSRICTLRGGYALASVPNALLLTFTSSPVRLTGFSALKPQIVTLPHTEIPGKRESLNNCRPGPGTMPGSALPQFVYFMAG